MVLKVTAAVDMDTLVVLNRETSRERKSEAKTKKINFHFIVIVLVAVPRSSPMSLSTGASKSDNGME